MITHITISRDKEKLRVAVADISVFQAEDKYVTVTTSTGKTYIYTGTLRTLEPNLPDTFIRIHRNALVNKDFIIALSRAERLAEHGTLPDGFSKNGRVLYVTGHAGPLAISRRNQSAVTRFFKT